MEIILQHYLVSIFFFVVKIAYISLASCNSKLISFFTNNCVPDSVNLADGHMYIWGRGFTGTSDISYPQCAISSTSLSQMALGWHHALVLTGK